MLATLHHNGPTVFFEHKLLSESFLEFLGSGGRSTVHYDVPANGRRGSVPSKWEPLIIGEAILRRTGNDITLISVGVGVHRALEAVTDLENDGISASVLDLRTVSPLDKSKICENVARTGHMLVIDEDYESFGLSGELAAVVMEAGIPAKYSRVCTQTTIPYSRTMEDQTLPNVMRIHGAAVKLLSQ